ncbi:MAG TPA: ABC transporter ATP-binding protein [Vicinamibacteria bacterium]|nr:ABC transporter ATP-binding protein [Vicinamibacteria bacterium]
MLEVRDLVKEYPSPSGPLSVLKGITLELSPGDALSIMGPSGGGKSTLLFILGALDIPTSGSVRLDGTDPFELPERELAEYRNSRVGFVFQDHCLLPQCSVLENVLAPTLVAPRAGYRSRAQALLSRVGLGERLAHRPSELSGGEKQRVAIARALIRDPRLVLCDEPTGNLDGKTASTVADLLLDLDRHEERMLIVVTHSVKLAERFPKQMGIVDGKLVAR